MGEASMTRMVACFVMLGNVALFFGLRAVGAMDTDIDDSAENWWKHGIGFEMAFDTNSDTACHAGDCQAKGDAEKQLQMLQSGAKPKRKTVGSHIAEKAQSASLPDAIGSLPSDASKQGGCNGTWCQLGRWASAPRHWLATMRARVAEHTKIKNQGAYKGGLQALSNVSPGGGGLDRVAIGFVGLLLATCFLLMWLCGRGAQSLLLSFPKVPLNPKREPTGLSASARQAAVLQTPKKGRDLLPSIYPKLVLPNTNARLAVPCEPLSEPHFDIDVLGLSGLPLLCASLTPSNAISISLHNVNTLLATVSAIQGGVEIRGSGGVLFGNIIPDELQIVLRDASDQPVMAIRHVSPDQSDLQFTSLNTESPEVFAVCAKCPAEDQLPAEHYSLSVEPGIDSVLVLACMLGAVVFELSGYRSILGLASSARKVTKQWRGGSQRMHSTART